VNITFSNRATGDRYTEAGVVGQTLLELCQNKGVAMGNAGKGGNVNSHVIVTKEWEAALPVSKWTQMTLDDIPADEVTSGSRLACEIVLTKEMDGMAVAVPVPKGPVELP